jgi:hypothetical protein
MLEKFYELAEKLSIKILTIEQVLEEEARKIHSESEFGKVVLYEKKHHSNDKQYKDFIKLYFNDIGRIPLLTGEEERAIARRIQR